MAAPNDGDADDFLVGYGKPPAETRFKPGQSGNPKGRPKGAKNFSTLMEKELAQKVTIKEGERRRRVSKREAMVKQLTNKAASGDHKSIQVVFDYDQKLEARRDAASADSVQMDQADQEVMEEMVRRIRELGQPDGGAEDGE
jgi:hypothetical protein